MTKPIPDKAFKGSFVQTQREAHNAWAMLIMTDKRAAQLMHIITARIGDNNAVVVSHKTLSKLMDCSVSTVIRGLRVLHKHRWVEVRQLGETASVNAYVVNDRVAWATNRDGLRYSLFSATVIISADEQPDENELGQQEPLRMAPPSYEDLFAPRDDSEAEPVGDLVSRMNFEVDDNA